MLASAIIEKFELNIDDQSTMSSQESLDLLNKVYHEVLDYRPWEWLKKEGTDTVASNQISAPADFKYFHENHIDADGNNMVVVFVGTDYDPYEVIPFTERRNHRDSGHYCYYDARQDIIVFTDSSAEGKVVEFDYIYQPDDLITSTEPVFPTRFHDVIYFGMAVDFGPIDNTPKSRSYAEEFQVKFDRLLEDMSYENSKLYGRSNY
ncbi:hypothetical protein N8148_02770 [Gammaproteobacteria bacterium]|nr:hypothetical protein [Gammaproteobacteria bacterium]